MLPPNAKRAIANLADTNPVTRLKAARELHEMAERLLDEAFYEYERELAHRAVKYPAPSAPHRKKREYTLRDIAEVLGVSHTTVRETYFSE